MSKPPHNQRGAQTKQTQPPTQSVSVQAIASQWSGPLPSPESLEHFNHVIPNGAERIVAMAEAEQAHRLSYERAGLDAGVREARRGQLLGAGISAIAIVAAVIAVYAGAHWSVSCALVGVPILGIVRAIVNSRSQPHS